jgi:nicotinamide mononucleotide (NMN) deamidase PncC
VWVAAAVGDEVVVAGDRFPGDRAAVRAAAVQLALDTLARALPPAE